MKKGKRRVFIVPAIAMLSLLFSFSPSAPLEFIPDSSLLAGAARINCSPWTPIPMSGYEARKDPFKGIHDSLFVRAVVFSDGTNRPLVKLKRLPEFSMTTSCWLPLTITGDL